MRAGGSAGLPEPGRRGLKSSHDLLCFLFAALYGSARFYLFLMDVKTFITVQGQRRKACIETEPPQVATRDGLNLQVRVNVANGWMPFRDACNKMAARKSGADRRERRGRARLCARPGCGERFPGPGLLTEGAAVLPLLSLFLLPSSHPPSRPSLPLSPSLPHVVFVLSSGSFQDPD